jgi:NAD(P)-dependent dehydrogenase (short-subunit alcohol dehydrogenase family)
VRLAGQVVVVTGATSGIGRAVTERCLAEGAAVLATGRRLETLDDLAAPPERLALVAADLTDDDAPARLVAACAERFGRIDGLVHSAGTVRRGEDPRTATDAELRAFLETNLVSTIRLSRAVFAAIADGGRGGSIVLLGSQLAHIAFPGHASYSAVKGGVTAFGRALALDGGPLGIRVNVIAPGVVHTAMSYVDRPGFDDMIPEFAARHPLRRIGRPEDIAGPAAFLLSDDSSWITAQTIIVDGGFTAQ